MKARMGALSLLLACAWSAAGADQVPPQITVIGFAEVKVAPDEVAFDIVIEALDKDIAKSRDSCEVRFKKLIESARRHGLTDKDIQAGQLSIEPESHYRQQTEAYEFIGYRTRYSLELTLRDLSRHEALLTDILQTPVDRLSAQWRSSKERELRAEARRLAVLAAKEKAAALAEALGQHIGPAYSVTERYTSGDQCRLAGRWAEMGTSESTAHPGELTITGEVSASFLLSNNFLDSFFFTQPESRKNGGQ